MSTRSARLRIAVLGLVATATVVGVAIGTPGSGVDAVNLTRGVIEDNATTISRDGRTRSGGAGRSDALFQLATVAPGGHTGWHSHPSSTWVVVTKGELTHYLGHDPACTPHRYGPGAGFHQPPGEIHIARNEGPVTTEFYVFYTGLRSGQAARTDEAKAANCPF